MAYFVEDTGKQRAQALVAVGLLHGVAIFAIASGFAGGVVNIVRDTLVTRDYPNDVKIAPIAPPDVEPSAQPAETTRVAPTSKIVLGPVDPGVEIREIDKPVIPPLAGGLLIEPRTPPAPTPSASSAVRNASPKSSPGSWFQTATIRAQRSARSAKASHGFASPSDLTVG